MRRLCLLPAGGKPFHRILWKLSALLVLWLILPEFLPAQTRGADPAADSFQSQMLLSGLASVAAALRAQPGANTPRKDRVLRTSRWIGAAAGLGVGLLHTYWSITYPPHPGIPVWKNLLVGLPSAAVSGYAGYRVMHWAARRIMAGSPRFFPAALKGAFYGAVAGAVILTANTLPFFLGSYYLHTLRFNFSGEHVVLKVLGTSILGGIGYGGLTGLAAGAVYGPCVAVYMKF